MRARNLDKEPYPLVIVGSGFASFCLIAHLLKARPDFGKKITVIGPEPIGFGAAYGCTHRDFRLNVRAQIMRIFSENPNDFLHWAAREIKDEEAHKPQGAFYRRADFAMYLSALRDQLDGFDDVRVIPAQVTAADRVDAGWHLTLDSNETLLAGQLVLATGNPPPRWPCSIKAALPADKAVENPWSGDWLATLHNTDAVTFIGGGLTAMDGIYSLARQGHMGPIEIVLPHPVLPPEQTDWQPEAPIHWPENIHTASQFFRFMKNSLGSRDWEQPRWQSRFEALRIHLSAAWQRLDEGAQRRLMRHAGKWWQLARFRSAPQNFEAAQAMLKSGQLRLTKGRVVQIAKQGRQIQLKLEDGQNRLADAVINCTGPAPDPLIAQMRKAGLVAPDISNRAARIGPDLRVLKPQQIAYDTLFGVGAMSASSLGDVIGAGSIAKQAEQLAKILAS